MGDATPGSTASGVERTALDGGVAEEEEVR